ncbi:MAG: transposase zinc-binding domain-containing protein [Myxococcales bacterium]
MRCRKRSRRAACRWCRSSGRRATPRVQSGESSSPPRRNALICPPPTDPPLPRSARSRCISPEAALADKLAKYLRCGVLAHGFARVRCGDCGFELLVGFSCKVRGLCSSCDARRMHDSTEHLLTRVLPPRTSGSGCSRFPSGCGSCWRETPG